MLKYLERKEFATDRKLCLFACACRRQTDHEWPVGNGWTEAEEDPCLLLKYDDGPWAQGMSWAYLFLEDYWSPENLIGPHLVREIFGNPFHRVTLKRETWTPGHVGLVRDGWVSHYPWLTDTVMSLAKTSYEHRLDDGSLDPERLLVLSDALEDAGCDQEDLLRHLRGWEFCPCQINGFEWSHGNEEMCGGQGKIKLRCKHYRGCWALDLILGKD